MKRRLVTLAAVASLVLCVATLALWVRSYFRLDTVIHRAIDRPRMAYMQSLVGEVHLGIVVHTSAANPLIGWQYHESMDPMVTRKLKDVGRGREPFLGFSFAGTNAFSIPHWFLALLFAIPPALRLRAAIRARRLHRIGNCARCGYDLRATPERCPECGAVPAGI